MKLQKLIEARDIEGLRTYMAENDLVVRDGKIVPVDDATKQKFADLSGFWNQRQQARKILLG